MIVERATEEDLEGIIDVDAAHNGAPRVAYLVDTVKKRQCYFARAGSEIVGYILLTRQFFGHSFIELLVVHPQHRCMGVGSTLIRHIEMILPAEKLFTSTNVSNKAMQALCEKLGYGRSGWIENLDDGDPEIVYFKRISTINR